MDDLVAALHLLAQKLRVDVHELSDRYVLYTQVTAVVICVVYLICAYVAYRVIDYVYEAYIKGNPMNILDAGLPRERKGPQYEYEKQRLDASAATHLAGAKIARTVLMALIMGSFLISSALQISTIAVPRGAALENVLESLEDATKVEIVQEKLSTAEQNRRRRERERKEKSADNDRAADSGDNPVVGSGD